MASRINSTIKGERSTNTTGQPRQARTNASLAKPAVASSTVGGALPCFSPIALAIL